MVTDIYEDKHSRSETSIPLFKKMMTTPCTRLVIYPKNIANLKLDHADGADCLSWATVDDKPAAGVATVAKAHDGRLLCNKWGV